MDQDNAFMILGKALDDAGGSCMRWGAALGAALGLASLAAMLAFGGGLFAAMACGASVMLVSGTWLIGQLCEQAQARRLGAQELLALDAVDWSPEAAEKLSSALAIRAVAGDAIRAGDVEPAWLAQREFEKARSIFEREKVVLELNERLSKRFSRQ